MDAATASHKLSPWECAICLEEHSPDAAAAVKALGRCGHLFHKACLGKWLVNHQSCPSCRQPWKLSLETSFSPGVEQLKAALALRQGQVRRLSRAQRATTVAEHALGSLKEARAVLLDQLREVRLKSSVVSAEQLAACGLPKGMLDAFLRLADFDALEFILDDSGSMHQYSEERDEEGRWQTRWQALFQQIKALLRPLSRLARLQVRITFLNRQDTIFIRRAGQAPEDWLRAMLHQVELCFAAKPGGRTPLLRRLEQSFQRAADQSILRYIFCDGEPDAGIVALRQMKALLAERKAPAANPVTFVSCSDEPEDTDWMWSLNAPHCVALGSYQDLCDESRRCQGRALPYTRGMHVARLLTDVFSGSDLIAEPTHQANHSRLLESIPRTKAQLEGLLGVSCSTQEYRHYFDEFKLAQLRRVVDCRLDWLLKKVDWEADYQAFLHQRESRWIPCVVFLHEAAAGLL